jgi:hypothetical protein
MGVLPFFSGVLCHDHWKPYYRYACTHSLCNAHHLRELERAWEQDGQHWAKAMKALLIDMNNTVADAGGCLPATDAERWRQRYRQRLEEADSECPPPDVSLREAGKRGRLKRSKARKLLERLRNFEHDVVSIQYIHEEEPLGTGGALGLLPHEEIDLPVIMMNGDLLTSLNIHSFLEFHNNHTCVATMCVREYEYQVPYGVVTSEGAQIRSMVEKPVHKFFVNAGIYLLNPELVKSVGHGTRIDMPTLLEQEIDEGRPVNMFPIHEYWLDIGRMDDFQRAQNEAENALNG